MYKKLSGRRHQRAQCEPNVRRVSLYPGDLDHFFSGIFHWFLPLYTMCSTNCRGPVPIICNLLPIKTALLYTNSILQLKISSICTQLVRSSAICSSIKTAVLLYIQWNQINQKNFSWNYIFGSFKLFPSSKIEFLPFLKLQKMEFDLKIFSWNWFIWFHEFFWPGLF